MSNRFSYYSEYINGTVWFGLVICFISLFLPWLTLSGLFGGPFGAALQASWFNLVQTEIPKIQTEGIITYLSNSNYLLIDVTILPILGFGLCVVGSLVRKNWIIFAGSFFMVIASFVLFYFLNEGISGFGLQINLISLAGIGLWGFLLGSILAAYGSGQHMRGSRVFPSAVVVAILAAFMLSNFTFPFKLNISGLTNTTITSTTSYPTEQAKAMMQEVINNYFTPTTDSFGRTTQHTINDLTIQGPQFGGQTFAGYSVCPDGFTGYYACSYGKNQGENVNYLYCRPTYFQFPYIFCDKKTIVSSTGEIQQILRDCLNNFILDPSTRQIISINVTTSNEASLPNYC